MYRLIFLFIISSFASAWAAANAQHEPRKVFDDPSAYSSLTKIVEKVTERDTAGIVGLLHSDFHQTDGAADELAQLLDTIPDGDLNFEMFFAENRVGMGEYAGVPIYFAAYESATENGFVQLNLAVAPENEVCCVGTYMNVIPSDVRPSTYNDLTFVGKGWLHFLVAILAVVVIGLTVFTGIKCAVASDTARKWLWVPFVLIGLWGVTFNWTTGELAPSFMTISDTGFHVSLIQFKLLGVSATTVGAFHPWIVEIGAPVGALIYWLFPGLRKRKEIIPEIESLE